MLLRRSAIGQERTLTIECICPIRIEASTMIKYRPSSLL